MSTPIVARSIQVAKAISGPADIAILITDVGGSEYSIAVNAQLARRLVDEIALHVDVANDGVN